MAISIYPETVPVVIRDPVTETSIRLISFPPEISQLRQYIRKIEPNYDESDNLVLDYLRDNRYESITGLTLDTANRELKVLSPIQWEQKASTPFTTNAGAFIIVGNYGYLVRTNTTEFWRYDIINDQWTRLADLPFSSGYYPGICYNGDDWIYVLQGSGSGFARYSISQNSWTVRTSYPAIATGSLGYDPINNRVYGVTGNTSNGFYYYTEISNSWTGAPTTPAYIGRPHPFMPYTNGYLYLLESFSTQSIPYRGFYRYSVLNNSWEVLTMSPLCADYRPAFAAHTNDKLFACFPQNNRIFVYIISKNSWIEVFPSAPITFYNTNGGDIWGDYFYFSEGNNTNRLWRLKILNISWSTEYISKTRILLDRYKTCYVVARNMVWYFNNSYIPTCQISYDDGTTWLPTTLLGTDLFTAPDTNTPIENWFYRTETAPLDVGSKFKIKINLTRNVEISEIPTNQVMYKNLIGAMLLK